MQSVIRLFILILIISGVIYLWSRRPDLANAFFSYPPVNQAVNVLTDKVKGASTSLNIDLAGILKPTTNTQSANSEINSRLEKLTSEVTEKIKDIPKNQAKEIVTNVCNQIITNIEKQ